MSLWENVRDKKKRGEKMNSKKIALFLLKFTQNQKKVFRTVKKIKIKKNQLKKHNGFCCMAKKRR